MKPDVVNVHIDQLLIQGVEHIDGNQVSTAVQRELRRLIAVQGLHPSLQQPASIRSVKAKPISTSGGINERGLGYQIASSVYRGLK